MSLEKTLLRMIDLSKPFFLYDYRSEKEKFIIMKYADREFIHQGLPPNCSTVDIAFHEATKEGNLAFMLKYLLQGANVNWRNPENHLQSALHVAVAADLHVTVEYLLIWSADCLITDEEHLTPIHYALRQNRSQMSLSLLRHALHDHPNLDIRELVHSAISNNVDIVDAHSLAAILESAAKLQDSPNLRIFSNHSYTNETSPTKPSELDEKELPPLPEHVNRSSESTIDSSSPLERDLPNLPEFPDKLMAPPSFRESL
jgi:ankyrin repeat protein